MRKKICSNCVYWDNKDDYDGVCRKNPPTLIMCDEHLREYSEKWPTVSYKDWCGSHEFNKEG